ncbi:MAG: choice-of-anchor P family protein [Acidimicrobiales bacterium]
MSSKARLTLTALRVVLALVVAGSAANVVRPPVADATPAASSLGGYNGTAAASGLHLLYNPEGLLPIGAPVDVGAPDALATIGTGPATFARASVFDPGDVLYNPDFMLSQIAAGWPQGTIPKFPYRVMASSGSEVPRAESSPAPGLNAVVTADESGSKGQATMLAADTPGVVSVTTMSSTASTVLDGSTVKVHSRSEIGGFDLLGVVSIDSIVTDLTATSQGQETDLSGGTTVVGASVLGQPVTIGPDGVELQPGSPSGLPGGPLNGVFNTLSGSLNDVLAQAGVRVTVAGPVKQSGDQSGELASTGLRIDLEFSDKTFPLMKTLVDLIPPLDAPIPGAPGPEDVLAALRARHLVSLEVGRGLVTLTARPGFEFQVPTASLPSDFLPGEMPAVLPGFVSSPLAAPSAVRTPATSRTSVAATSPLPITFGPGVGALALLLLALQPLIGNRVGRMCQIVLGGDAAEGCPVEVR